MILSLIAAGPLEAARRGWYESVHRGVITGLHLLTGALDCA